MGAALKLDTPEIDQYQASMQEPLADFLEVVKSAQPSATEKSILAEQFLKEEFAVDAVCNHFSHHLNTVFQGVNALTQDANAATASDVSNEDVDAVYYHYDKIEDYVEFICNDFQHFSDTVAKVFPDKSKMPISARNRLNQVEYLFESLDSQVARQKTAVLSMLISKLTPEQVQQRLV